MKRTLIVITLLALGLLTLLAVLHDGLAGIFSSIFSSWGAAQIYADLFISLVLIMIWIWRDAKTAGRNPWGWITATLAVGVFSPLIYLLLYKSSSAAPDGNK